MNLYQQDHELLGRDAPPLPEVTNASGSIVYGANGEEYIDFLMGWCVGNFGWGNKEIRDTIDNFDGPDYVNPFALFRPWVELAELLAEIAPGNLKKSFRATGGTEAVEIALQAAMAHTGRTKFLSIEGGYHGHSIGAMSIGVSAFRSTYKNLLPDCYKISPPLNKKAAIEAEKIIKRGDIAAFISEPVICNLGVVIPTQEYYDRIQHACKKYGTVFIVDEVATGFGRTGKLFASEWYGLEPDILCLGKAITGGYAGLGATVMTEKVAKSMEFNFSWYSTFGWHPRSTVAALATIRYFQKNKSTLLSNAEKISKIIASELHEMPYRYKPDIRIKGLAIGLQWKEAEYAIEICKNAMKQKLLISELGPWILTIFPALTIDETTAKEGLRRFRNSL